MSLLPQLVLQCELTTIISPGQTIVCGSDSRIALYLHIPLEKGRQQGLELTFMKRIHSCLPYKMEIGSVNIDDESVIVG